LTGVVIRASKQTATRYERSEPGELVHAGPLVAQGYPSIGCAPCTSKVAPGEDPRSGRWKGWDKTECGIHVPGGKDGDNDLPPEYQPAF
jgi:hypothetical protein